MQFSVENPERWWLAAREDLTFLVDPDEDDGRLRWDDRFERDWANIGAAAAEIGEQLSSGMCPPDPEEPGAVLVTVRDLAAPEMKIVRSWLIDPPMVDPGDDWPVNGRHRLWNCFEATPQIALLVLSQILPYLDSIAETPTLGETIGESALFQVQALSQSQRARNPRFAAELERVGAMYPPERGLACRGTVVGAKPLRLA